MGEASVAVHTDAPLALITNPAHLGMFSQHSRFSFDHNFSSWLPSFSSDISYRTFGFAGGFNLRDVSAEAPSLSVGLAYSRVQLDLGEFVATNSDGTPIGTYEAFETSDQYTLGVGIDYHIRASAGIAFKRVSSHLGAPTLQSQLGEYTTPVNLYDYGFFLEVPFMEIASEVRGEQLHILPYVSPLVDFSIGFAHSNLGTQRVVYVDAARADPLPRYARTGIGLRLGLEYADEDLEIRPVTFKWTVEANDLLFRRFAQGWEYQDGLGDIDFFREVISGKTNSETIKKKGWEFDILEIVSLRGGRFEEDVNRGNRNFSTSGYGVRLAGILKFFRSVESPDTDSVLRFLVDHVDVRYNHSEYQTDAGQPLANTRFDAFTVVLAD
jgi:hypothetical protein